MFDNVSEQEYTDYINYIQQSLSLRYNGEK
jgi:hypothetical protein